MGFSKGKGLVEYVAIAPQVEFLHVFSKICVDHSCHSSFAPP